MRKADRSGLGGLRPVENIDVKGDHVALRAVIFVVLIVIAISAFAYAISSLFTEESGWRTVAAESSAAADCSDEFTFTYEFGLAGVSVKKEYDALAALYGQAADEAYKLFHETEFFGDLHNVAYLNAHPNETVEVDETLYEAFSLLAASESRQLYISPIIEYYAVLFSCTEDYEAEEYDPVYNEDLAGLFSEILAYTNDPAMINLELLGDGRIRLFVSDAYLAFAGANDIYTFISFHFMKNAFIVDFLANTFIQNGYTHGSISSFDGFSRNLDDRELTYALNLFDISENTVYIPGTLNYTGRKSLVTLRAFPVSPDDDPHYYVTDAGEIRFHYIDPTRGTCLASVGSLMCSSDSLGCAEILLRMIPLYIADFLDTDALATMSARDGIESVFCSDGVIFYTDPEVMIENILDLGNGAYTKSRIPAK